MADLMIWYPIGTRPEIDALGLPSNTTASCSMQTSDNRGCPWFSKCRFRQIRDGHTPPGHTQALKGPENVAVYVQLSQGQGGAADIKFMSCEMYYQSGLHQRWRHMVSDDSSGEVIKVLGIAGDGKKYIQKEQVKKHLIKDPNCPNCATNTCILMTPRVGKDGKAIRVEIPRFPRPNQSLEDIALGAEISKEIRAEVERDMEREALNMNDFVPEEEEEAEVESGAKGKS